MEAKKNQDNPQKQSKAAEDKTVTLKESEYAQLKQEALKGEEYWDKYVRLQADFENTRKRWERDKSELLRYANDDLLCDLLNVVDDLERSVELSQEKHEDFTAFLKGVEMILAHLHDLLKSNGVSPINALGKPFDPNLHEALMQVEDQNKPEHTVVEELQKGYLLNNKVLRTAKVKVAVTKADNTAEVKDVELKDKDGRDK
jgi:molecular chaperone GrpE